MRVGDIDVPRALPPIAPQRPAAAIDRVAVYRDGLADQLWSGDSYGAEHSTRMLLELANEGEDSLTIGQALNDALRAAIQSPGGVSVRD